MVSTHKCNSCFYMEAPKDSWPCKYCEGYNKFVNRDIYIHQPAAKGEDYFISDTVAIKEWEDEDAFVEREREQHMKSDSVDSPAHYTAGQYEVIDVIEDWNLNFRLANTVKYIARHKHKGKPLEDLKKAAWYLQREIDTWTSRSKS